MTTQAARPLIALIAILVFATVYPAQDVSDDHSGDVDQLDWMTGTWTMETATMKIEEQWTHVAGGSLLGTNRTIRDGKMVAFEYLRIVTRGDGVYYIAQPNGRPGTDFKLTRIADGEVVFENPEHDFPQWIRYRRISSDALRADVKGTTSKGPRSLTFEFSRMESAPQN